MEKEAEIIDPFKADKVSPVVKFLWIVFVLIVLAAMAAPVIGALLMPRLETVVTIQDFDSHQQCVDFLNRHLPLPLPAGAKVCSFELVSWLDWELTASVELPTETGKDYFQAIQNLNASETTISATSTDLPEDEIPKSVDYDVDGESRFSGRITLGEASRALSIKCYSH